MNWHYSNPIVDGRYICCVRGFACPIVADWYGGEWGIWDMSRGNGWHPIDKYEIVCYTSFDEIPMPENW